MNYLAHIYLSGDKPEMMVGGLLGDFVKGTLKGELPENIETGITLHRRIDVFVDQQPEITTAQSRFSAPYRRFSGIYLDVCYDHFLAKNWPNFHQQPLERFCRNFYQTLREYNRLLPPRALHFSEVAPAVGWLEGYTDFGNLEIMLQRIGERFKKSQPLHEGFFILQRDYDVLEQEFLTLFPRLIDFTLSQQLQLSGTIADA